VAVTVIEPVASVAVLATFETVTSTSSCSVELKDVEPKLIVAVFDVDVIVPGAIVGFTADAVPPVLACLADTDSVTPVGMLENVSLMFEPFAGCDVLFELWVVVRQHEAQPSVIVNDPAGLTMLLFVKIEAVPREVPPARAPIANPLVAMPGFSALMIVPLLVPIK